MSRLLANAANVPMVIALLLTMSPSVVAAESALPSCWPGEITPAARNVPANLPAFLLVGGAYYEVETPIVRLYRRMGVGDVDFALDVASGGGADLGKWVLTPGDPLVEGGTYVFVDESCPFESRETVYEVDAAVTLPTVLGVTTVGELRSSRSRPGTPLRYYLPVTLELSEEAEAARGILQGQRRSEPGTDGRWLPLGHFDERVSVPCELGAMLVPPWTSAMSHVAKLYGEEESLATEPVLVDVVCADAVRVDPYDEHVLSPEEIEEMDRLPPMDAGVMDGGVMDGGLSDGGFSDGGFSDGGLSDGGLDADAYDLGADMAGGCMCSAPGPGAGSGWFGGLLVLALARRRASRAR